MIRGLLSAGPVLLVAAHPDDETIGAGGILPELGGVTVLHLTDGAPRDRRWWGSPGFAAREDYARARGEELRAALALAGIVGERARGLGLADQEASAELSRLAREIAATVRDLRPAVVLTHPYEGGHPDHDAAAFAVHAACRMIERGGERAPAIVESPSYHARGEGIATGEFLPGDTGPGAGAETVELDEEQRARKARMLACFATQRETLAQFGGGERERFRLAPRYDFTRAPHEGVLNYERFEWGVTGPEWRERARAALAALGLAEEGEGRAMRGMVAVQEVGR